MEKLKKEEKRALIFQVRYNEDEEMNEVIVINKWYWIGTGRLRQMSPQVVFFVENILENKEVKPCVYLTKLNKDQIKERFSAEGLNEDHGLLRAFNF